MRVDVQSLKLPIYRLFILGAGFSAPANLPLGKDLLERVREDVRSHYHNFGWEGTLEGEIAEWTSLYPGQSIDLEKVLAYSHRKHHLRLLGSDEYFEHGSRSVVRCANGNPTDTHPSNSELHTNFVQRFRRAVMPQ